MTIIQKKNIVTKNISLSYYLFVKDTNFSSLHNNKNIHKEQKHTFLRYQLKILILYSLHNKI